MLVLTWVCSYCVRKRAELEQTLPGLGKPVALLGVTALLLLLEPDFGAATVLFATGFAVLFVAGARLRYVLLLVSAAAMAFAVLALTSAYRLKRLTGFLHPWDDPFNGGFQLTQSLIAIGRGSWFGVGLGSSVQKLFYLPEAHTDFVFAVLAEELGLVGVLGVIALFVALVWRAFQISRMAAQAGLPFQAYLALAFGVWLGLQAIVNIGVNMGVLPTKGLTLPLLSYGRSSLLVSLAWLGVLLRIYHEVKCTSRSAVMRMPGGTAMSGAAGVGPVLIMAGGTGGHVFPALAVAKVLRERGVAVVWLGVPGSMESRLVPANGFPIEWVRVAGIRGKGLADLAAGAAARDGRSAAVAADAAPRAAARRARRRRLRERTRRHRRLAAAHSAADPRTERHRRLDQSLAVAHRHPGAGSVSRQLRRERARPHHRQSGARRHRRPAGARGALRRPRTPGALAGVRRQPGRAAPECHRAAGAVAPRSLAPPAGSPPDRRARPRGRARRLCRARGRGRGSAVHRRHGRGLRVGGSRGVPRRRHDHRRVAGRRPRRAARAAGGGHR